MRRPAGSRRVTGGIQTRQVFHFELAGVEVLLVGVRGKQRAVGELAALPERPGAPDAGVAQDQRQRLGHQLILAQRTVGQPITGEHLIRVDDLRKQSNHKLITKDKVLTPPLQSRSFAKSMLSGEEEEEAGGGGGRRG